MEALKKPKVETNNSNGEQQFLDENLKAYQAVLENDVENADLFFKKLLEKYDPKV
ncbi:hypothetical protein OBO34_11360 [Clostridiales Family XIII bacterium ASD5510]|uniref:Uncharacterized protein n=1 Tax=Hominibacterium faecale TaxID=2839743 RepID=A0A9J6QS46_9FIRM|nr:hypothetical protein [Hominibacterium faecale]MCU7378954.1 hypothetical protein [Hominibacterium faecale]